MKVVIVADIDIAEDVSTCVLGYSSKDGWEEFEVTPRPLPQERAHNDLYEITWDDDIYALGYNRCLHEITGETDERSNDVQEESKDKKPVGE